MVYITKNLRGFTWYAKFEGHNFTAETLDELFHLMAQQFNSVVR